MREGVALGAVVATAIWIWLAVVDVIAGQPFRTFAVLGGVVPFTILHYLLNIAYSVALVAAVHRAAREPSLLIGVGFVSFIIEFGFVMLAILLSHTGLGTLAWPRILGGNLVGATVTVLWLARRHRLMALLRAEEREEEP